MRTERVRLTDLVAALLPGLSAEGARGSVTVSAEPVPLATRGDRRPGAARAGPVARGCGYPAPIRPVAPYGSPPARPGPGRRPGRGGHGLGTGGRGDGPSRCQPRCGPWPHDRYRAGRSPHRGTRGTRAARRRQNRDLGARRTRWPRFCYWAGERYHFHHRGGPGQRHLVVLAGMLARAARRGDSPARDRATRRATRRPRSAGKETQGGPAATRPARRTGAHATRVRSPPDCGALARRSARG